MLLSLIAAMDRNRVIGVDNDLPWRLPDDMRHFRRTTTGKPVIMGRKTYESIGKPLPKRYNIVLTRNREFAADGVVVCNDPQCAIDEAQATDAEEVVVIGGEAIYRLFLQQADRLYLTFVAADVAGDIYFPEVDFDQWKEVERVKHSADSKHPYAFDIVTFNRIPQPER